jgi:hypothetical protein
MNATATTIREIELQCDTGVCDYWIASMSDGCHVFAWGNWGNTQGFGGPKAGAGFARFRRGSGAVTDLHELENGSTADLGLSVHGTLKDAAQAWRDCAEALDHNGDQATLLEVLDTSGIEQ